MKKGQTATQFLMTYGWAFFLVIVFLSIFTFFGWLDWSKLVPSKFDSSLHECTQWKYDLNFCTETKEDSMLITSIKINHDLESFGTRTYQCFYDGTYMKANGAKCVSWDDKKVWTKDDVSNIEKEYCVEGGVWENKCDYENDPCIVPNSGLPLADGRLENCCTELPDGTLTCEVKFPEYSYIELYCLTSPEGKGWMGSGCECVEYVEGVCVLARPK